MKNYNIFEYVRDNINVLEVAKRFPEFYKSLEKSGHDYGTNCPTGHSSKSGRSFKLVNDGGSKDFFFCHSCSVTGDAFNLAQMLLGASVKETIEWFINQFNLDLGYLHNTTRTPEEELAEKKLNTETILYDTLIAEGKDLLFKPVGKDALTYLVTQRKYNPANIKLTEWFYLPPLPEAKQFLASCYPNLKEEIKGLQLMGHFGDLFRLCFPYRNRFGKVTGITKRSTIPEGATGTTWDGTPFTNQRWDSTKGMVKDDLFGLHKIKQGTKTLFLVEGYPDTMYIPTLGYENVAALGQGRMSKAHLIGLKKKNIKNVVISLDNDGVGPKNTAIAIELLFSAGINAYVVPPAELGIYKDPDEFVIAKGVDALNEIIQRAPEAEKWMIDWFYKDANMPLSRNEALANAINFSTNIFSPTGKVVFAEELAKKAGLTKRTIEKNLTDAAKKSNPSKEDKLTPEQKVVMGKNITQNLLTDAVKYDIIPFQELTNGDYAVFNKIDDMVIQMNSLDKIENMCLNYGIALPEVLPVMRTIFDAQQFERISIENKTINIFTPTQYMIDLRPDDRVFTPETDFPTTWKLINNLVANEDKAVRKHFLNWLAYIFQTREKSQIAWILKSLPGVGKNLFFDHVIKPFYGEKVCQVVENQDIQNTFNGYLANKMFLIFNEIAPSANERHSVKSVLKALITDATINIEEKYQKKITVKNHLNCLFFSNEFVPVIIEAEDRRYCVVKTGTPFKLDPTFKFRQFSRELSNERDTFYQYLMNWEVDYDAANTIIETPERDRMIKSSMSQIESFAFNLKKNNHEWFNSMQTKHLSNNSMFTQSGAIKLTDANLKNRISKSLAFQLYGAIFPSAHITAKSLTDLLENYGIHSERIMVDGVREYYFTW